MLGSERQSETTAIEPDLFWDEQDPESGATSVEDILDNYCPGEIVTIQRAVRISDVFAVQMWTADGLKMETREFGSVEDAEAWVEQRKAEIAAHEEGDDKAVNDAPS